MKENESDSLQLKRFRKGGESTYSIAQLLRAAGSISANIAEGFGRRSGAEYVHYLIVARGSTTESDNWLIKCRELGDIPEQVCREREALCQEVLTMLNAIIGALRRKAAGPLPPED